MVARAIRGRRATYPKRVTLQRPGGGGIAKAVVYEPCDLIQQYWDKGIFYESALLEHIAGLNLGGLFVDVGANIGNHTLFFAKFCADRVLAIEPNEWAVERMGELLKANRVLDKVEIHQVALLDEFASGFLVPFGAEETRNSGMMRIVKSIDQEAPGPIRVTSLDFLLLELGRPQVSLIKIDAEFSEFSILRGAVGTLNRDHPRLFVEVQNQQECDIMTAQLAGLGYRRGEQFRKVTEFIWGRE